MKYQFVLFDAVKTVPEPKGEFGQQSKYFDAKDGFEITLDPASQMFTVSRGQESISVHATRSLEARILKAPSKPIPVSPKPIKKGRRP